MHRAAILVMLMYFLKAYIPNLVENGPVPSYKSKFQFLYVNDLGLRSRNDLDLQYSHIFIISIGFRSQAAIVLKNQKFSLFSIEKP